MTGWRAGFALGPKQIIAAMSKLQSQSTSNTASMVQHAAIAALSGPQECVAEMRTDYLKLRDQMLDGFKENPGPHLHGAAGRVLRVPECERISGQGRHQDSLGARVTLLTEAHVVVVPGEAFGTNEHIRLCYAVRPAMIDKGIERMKQYLGAL